MTDVPAIRTSAANAVPRCVTPERLMTFLEARNPRLDPRFRNIAAFYKQHGETWRVRWDYAFFQMAIETNFLTYLRPNGKPGDVDPRQNNFAGIGTTGGGIPGDSYSDVSTGVLAQIQHLVVYSGERIAEPVAPRTRLKQDVILLASDPIAAKRSVTFQDLSGRWAVDKAYGRSITSVAQSFAAEFCRGEPAGGPVPGWAATASRTSAAAAAAALTKTPSAPTAVAAQPACRVMAASYGGTKTHLIRRDSPAVELTALTVPDREEPMLVQSFLAAHAPGGRVVATFASRQDALIRAYSDCPTAPR